MGNVRVVDAIIIVVYFAVMAVMGIIAYRRNKTSEDFFVAGKSMGTFSLAAMWLSSWIGGSSIVGTSTDAYNLGVTGGWYVTILAVGCAVFGLTFSKVTKTLGDKLKNITYPGLIMSRYDRVSSDIVIICCFLANVGFLASQLVAMGSMLTTITGWSASTCFIISTVITIAYSAIGGLMAIKYTTWIQFILIVLGTVVLGIPLSAKAMGGFSQLQTLPPEWFDIGRRGWPTILALLWAGLGVFFIAIGATIMGMAAKVLLPELPEGSSAYAALVAKFFPVGISGLVLVGVFAAIMSTGVVCINCCSANISVDIYKERIKPDAPDRSVMVLGIISSLLVGVVGALLAWWKYDIIELLLLAFTFQASALFFPTVFGVFWKKPTAKASSVSMIVSLAVVLLWLVGDGFGWGGIFTIDALWPGLLSSGVVFFVMTLAGKPTEADKQRCEIFFANPDAKPEEIK